MLIKIITPGTFPAIATIWIYFAACTFIALVVSEHEEISNKVDLVSEVTLPLVMALWICADARSRGKRLVYDYDSFAYFLWPILIPIYLFQTRGIRAVFTLIALRTPLRIVLWRGIHRLSNRFRPVKIIYQSNRWIRIYLQPKGK